MSIVQTPSPATDHVRRAPGQTPAPDRPLSRHVAPAIPSGPIRLNPHDPLGLSVWLAHHYPPPIADVPALPSDPRTQELLELAQLADEGEAIYQRILALLERMQGARPESPIIRSTRTGVRVLLDNLAPARLLSGFKPYLDVIDWESGVV